MLPAIASRLGLSTLSQAASSLGNVIITLIAARSFSEADFGAFATAYVVFVLAVGATRSLVGESVLVARLSTHDGEPIGLALGASSIIGVAVSLAAAGAGLLVQPRLSATLLGLAIVLPAMILHDAGRQVAFSLGDLKAAVIGDAMWLTSQLVLLVALAASIELTPSLLVIAWGAGAVPSVVFFIRRFGRPILRLTWLRTHWSLCWRYATEWMITTGGAYTALLILGLIVGTEAVGRVRAAQTLFGPLNTLFAGAVTVLVPMGIDAAPTLLRAMALRVSTGFGLLAAAFTLVLLALPDPVGEEVLGATWSSASTILVPVGLAAVAGGVLAGALVGLRARRAASVTLRARVATAPLVVLAPIAMSVQFGTEGFIWTSAVGAGAAALLWWAGFVRVLGDHAEVTAREEYRPRNG